MNVIQFPVKDNKHYIPKDLEERIDKLAEEHADILLAACYRMIGCDGDSEDYIEVTKVVTERLNEAFDRALGLLQET